MITLFTQSLEDKADTRDAAQLRRELRAAENAQPTGWMPLPA